MAHAEINTLTRSNALEGFIGFHNARTITSTWDKTADEYNKALEQKHFCKLKLDYQPLYWWLILDTFSRQESEWERTIFTCEETANAYREYRCEALAQLWKVNRDITDERESEWEKLFSLALHKVSRNYITESPFEKICSLQDDNNKKIKETILALKDNQSIQFHERIADRLTCLSDICEEECPGEAISYESLNYFISFLQLQSEKNLKYPDIILTPSKNIRIQWRTDYKHHFAVEFLPSGDAHFVIFSPNQKHTQKADRFSGHTSMDTLMQRVEPYDVLDWSRQ